MPAPARTAALVGGSALGVTAGARLWRSQAGRLARMGGSSIAAPDAAGWVTDFLNAAYFRRRPELRTLDDLRLASAVVTTRWHRGGHRRLHAPDVVAFHRAFGRMRLSTRRSPQGTLDSAQLLRGAERLLGAWFGEASADPGRRGWGIVFETPLELAGFVPEVRLMHARLGPLTPPVAAPSAQVWHTYPAVELPSADAAAALLARPDAWPEFGSELGRFTPVRSGGLGAQTFEIDLVVGTTTAFPVHTRGYVTATTLLDRSDPAALAAHVEALDAGLGDEGPALPPGADPVLALDLTTHEGHPLGRAISRILLFEHEGAGYIRDVGVWDPMPWHLAMAYDRAGRVAQEAFWGATDDPRRSMLHQIALACR